VGKNDKVQPVLFNPEWVEFDNNKWFGNIDSVADSTTLWLIQNLDF
jgi:hypothetical protein